MRSWGIVRRKVRSGSTFKQIQTCKDLKLNPSIGFNPQTQARYLNRSKSPPQQSPSIHANWVSNNPPSQWRDKRLVPGHRGGQDSRTTRTHVFVNTPYRTLRPCMQIHCSSQNKFPFGRSLQVWRSGGWVVEKGSAGDGVEDRGIAWRWRSDGAAEKESA
jgi:hypothetical protein